MTDLQLERRLWSDTIKLVEIQDWIKRSTDTLYKALKLDDEWLNLNEEEGKQLAEHLYIREFLVQCRKAANRVTSSVWESVQAKILAVPPPSQSPSALPLPTLDHKALFDLIFIHFDLSEIRGVCFEMKIEYESLPGDGTRNDKVRELIKHCDRHNRKHELLHNLRELRPAAFEGLK